MTVAEVHEEVSAALNELSKYFKKECQLTFIMRLPGNPECEMVITNDDVDGLIETLERSRNRDDSVRR